MAKTGGRPEAWLEVFSVVRMGYLKQATYQTLLIFSFIRVFVIDLRDSGQEEELETGL